MSVHTEAETSHVTVRPPAAGLSTRLPETTCISLPAVRLGIAGQTRPLREIDLAFAAFVDLTCRAVIPQYRLARSMKMKNEVGKCHPTRGRLLRVRVWPFDKLWQKARGPRYILPILIAERRDGHTFLMQR